MWKAILSGPLALLSVALSNPENPFPVKKMSGEKCMSWTTAIDLNLVKEIKTKTGNESSQVVLGLSAYTGKHCIFGHLGLVFIWSCFVFCLLFLLFCVICAPVPAEGTVVF